MLKAAVILCLVGFIVALPSNGVRSKEEVEEFKKFLLKTKKDDGTTLKEKMARNPKASAWENSGKYDGDIVLVDEEIEEMVAEYAGDATSPTRNGFVDKSHYWPGGVVYYDIAPNTFNSAQLQMIQIAANFFHQTSCTRWERRTNQRDYVLITGQQNGCYATVGYWAGLGAHTLNLASDCFSPFLVIHEMLHSMAFHHMHQTYVRDDYVTINFNNVAQDQRHNFNIFSNQVVTMQGLPYEYASIMHYAAYAFSANGQPTIIPKLETNGQMGQLNQATQHDILRLKRLYNCPGAWSVQLNPEDAGKPYTNEFGEILKQAADEEIRNRAAEAEEENEEVKDVYSEVNVVDSLINEKVEDLDAKVNVVYSS